MKKRLARHHLVEFLGCPAARLDAPGLVLASIRRLCRQTGLRPVRFARHRFSPRGLTILGILEESHLAYSSWPEHRYAALSLQLCGQAAGLGEALAGLGKALGASRIRRRQWVCGI